jgi:hypothetical protein
MKNGITKINSKLKNYSAQSKKTKVRANHTFKLNPELTTEKTELYMEPLKVWNLCLSGIMTIRTNGNQSFQYMIISGISDLAYTTYRVDNKRVIISHLTDQIGAPIKGVKVSILSQNYNPGNRRFEFIRSNDYTSNISTGE